MSTKKLREVIECADCKYMHETNGFLWCRCTAGLERALKADDFCSTAVAKEHIDNMDDIVLDESIPIIKWLGPRV